MEVVLVMCRADGNRRSFPVVRPSIVIGRREDSDFRIPLADVSRKHCRLVQDQGRLRVEDLGSSNGTLVNGKRIQIHTLEPGDLLTVGPVRFVVQINGIPADDAIADQMILAERAQATTATGDDEIARILAEPDAPSSHDDSAAGDVLVDFSARKQS
jgi:pSer/pThr/pTyr-binding forkhead associated (FHA) protein